MFLVNGEWLDHGDPRVDALWVNHPLLRPRDASVEACRALVPDHDYIEAAASYPEDSYGCMASRMAYGTPLCRRNLTHLEGG